MRGGPVPKRGEPPNRPLLRRGTILAGVPRQELRGSSNEKMESFIPPPVTSPCLVTEQGPLLWAKTSQNCLIPLSVVTKTVVES